MMMRMLDRGGIDVLTDNLREPDSDNPRGYYEYERVKQIEHDASWLKDAQGKAVKIISQLLWHLPSSYAYKVVFMRRRMDEILASQRRMLIRRGENADAIADEEMAALFRRHLTRVESWLDDQPNVDVVYVSYNRVLDHPEPAARRIDAFLDKDLDVDAMVRVVDKRLYRQRA